MKKLLLGLMALLVLAGCNMENELNLKKDELTVDAPSTEVYVNGTRATTYTDEMNAEETKAMPPIARAWGPYYDYAYFFIRIDNTIPGMTGTVPTQRFFPRTEEGDLRYCELNNGSIRRRFSYNYLGRAAITDYVYDPRGEVTSLALVNIPTLDDLLNAHKGVEPLADYLEHVDKSQLKVIWYLADHKPADPLRGYQKTWNVNGILTTNDVTDVRTIPDMIIYEDEYRVESKLDKIGQVKVDIHQQKHYDWEAIKTTIHVGSVVDNIKVSFPIAKADLCEPSDFAVRTYDAYYTVDDLGFNTKIQIAHKDDEVVITIRDLAPDMITTERMINPDGLTIEVWTFPRQANEAEDLTTYRQSIYDKLKQAKVTVDPNYPRYSPDKDTPAVQDGKMYTQVSSAFF